MRENVSSTLASENLDTACWRVSSIARHSRSMVSVGLSGNEVFWTSSGSALLDRTTGRKRMWQVAFRVRSELLGSRLCRASRPRPYLNRLQIFHQILYPHGPAIHVHLHLVKNWSPHRHLPRPMRRDHPFPHNDPPHARHRKLAPVFLRN